ncbi:hypothetical protein LTR86_004707 [Recurvomyces mirabilis]|nr:hypothetical protein LTR86_004707 [Recurvomyces mirabilis]
MSNGLEQEVELAPYSHASRFGDVDSSGRDGDTIHLITRKHDRLGKEPAESVDVVEPAAAKRTGAVARVRNKAKRKLQGWRVGVLCSAVLAFAVMLINIGFTAYLIAHDRASVGDGIGTVLTGSCKEVGRWSTGLHVIINILSSIMLSTSNYTMQCLCAPTREEINQVHARGTYLDIGLASLRNLSSIRWHRVLLWCVLALSSLPIHFLYNSAVFKTIGAEDYYVAVVNEEFFNGNPFLDSYNLTYTNSRGVELTINETFDNELDLLQKDISTNAAYKNASLYERLSNSDCIGTYGTPFVTDRSDLLVVTSARTDIANQTAFGGEAWICSDDPTATAKNCDIAKQRRKAETWTQSGLPIEYCLSQLIPGPGLCRLKFSVNILIVVIVMNACKCLVMLLTLWRGKEVPLVTVGDALASFLQEPDSLTEGRCLMAKTDVTQGPLRWSSPTSEGHQLLKPVAAYWQPVRYRWFAAVGIWRWAFTLGLITGALGGATALLVVASNFLKLKLDSGQSVFGLGFGTVDARAVIIDSLPNAGLATEVLLANLPQVICSLLYFAYNGLFTSMLLSHEYSHYMLRHRRKALRVSSPKGEQSMLCPNR